MTLSSSSIGDEQLPERVWLFRRGTDGSETDGTANFEVRDGERAVLGALLDSSRLFSTRRPSHTSDSAQHEDDHRAANEAPHE